MALTPFDRIMNSVRPHLPGAMDAAIKNEFYLVALDFFKRSDVWWEEVEFMGNGGLSYDVFPTMGRVNRLLFVMNPDDIRVSMAMPTKGTITARSPLADGVLHRATFSITVNDPTDASSFPLIPYDLVELYTEEFIAGILYRMMVQPAKPYTNLALGAAYRLQYNSALGRARNDKMQENTVGNQRWQFPRFA